ncbi:ABC transporter permease [Streptodolium elevatio]
MPRSRFAWRDLVAQALAGMLQRPARSMLTALGTVLGVGTFVAVLGITATASGQIGDRFNKFTATEVTVEDTGGEDSEHVPVALPPDADARVGALNGVTAAGTYWDVRLSAGGGVRAAPVGGDRQSQATPVLAASAGVLRAAGATFAQGRSWDAFHDGRAELVAVVGPGVAARFGISTLETLPAVFIDDIPFTVVGILADTERKPDLLMSVVVPHTAAEAIWGPPDPGARAAMLVSTEMGAARQVAQEAPYALRPDHPDYFKTVAPPDPRSLRENVTSDLDTLFLLLAGICLVIGAVGIANTTLVAVMERTAEIGLRRALGARGHHVAGQFIAESSTLGVVGGLIGTSLGTATVVATAAARDWTPIVHPLLVLAAPFVGLVTGLVAGLYPSWRAARIEPVEALRR